MKYEIDLDACHVGWYKNEEYHRIYGPAKECTIGSRAWYKDGKLYRLNGPVAEYVDDEKYTL